jgi:hypothetical protein
MAPVPIADPSPFGRGLQLVFNLAGFIPTLARKANQAGRTTKIRTRSGSGTPPIYRDLERLISGLEAARQERARQERARNPLLDLLEQLEAPVAGPDLGTIRSQIDPVFDARIAALQRAIEIQEGRVRRAREDIENMYEALARDYERLAPKAAAQADAARQEIENLYGQLVSNVEGSFQRIAQEQGDILRQLGIEEAAPAVLSPQAELTSQATSAAEQLNAINQQRYIDIGNIDESYFRQGAPLARLQGSNRSTDLLEQLQDFIAATQSEISMAEAERAAAINQLIAQAQRDARQQEMSQTQMLFDLYRSMQGQAPEIPASQAYLSSLPPHLQESVASIVRSIERSPEVILNRVRDPRAANPDTYTSVTPEWWFDQIDRLYEAGQIDDTTRQAVLNFLRLRFEE